MALAYPLPRQFRQTEPFNGDGRTTYGPFNFKIFASRDIVAFVSRNGAPYAEEPVNVSLAGIGAFEDFTAAFSPALVANDRAIVSSRRLHERSVAVTRGGTISAAALELELSKQGSVLQELRRDVNAALEGKGFGGGGGDDGGIGEAPIDDYLYGRKNAQWTRVPASEGGGIADAPKDGKSYVRKDGGWTVGTGGGTSNFAYSARDYGAKGDGTTDDSKAIGDAFGQPGTLEFGPATYKLGSNVAIPVGECFNILPGVAFIGANLTANGMAMQALPFTGDRKISVGNNAALTVEQYGTGDFKNAAFAVETFENFNVGNGAFGIGQLIRARKNGGTGHREALHVEQTSANSAANEFVVGIMGSGSISAGSGMVFGINGYSQVLAGALATANCVGGELNTDLRREAASKVGLQIVDTNTSIGRGTVYDAAILIGAQAGANQFDVGLLFGANGGDANFAVHKGGTLIAAKSTGLLLRAGLDLEGIGNWNIAPILLSKGGGGRGIAFGSDYGGGEIRSEVSSGAGKINFRPEGVEFLNNAGDVTPNNELAIFVPEASYLRFLVGENTSVLRRIIADAPNSARSGYRNIICEN